MQLSAAAARGVLAGGDDPEPAVVKDNLGSPFAGDTTMGVERVQPLFHLFNGDLCYANIATDRVRTWSDPDPRVAGSVGVS